MMISKAINKRVLSFGTIGVANTLIDVTIFLALRQLFFGILFANIISTSCALGFSYLMNKRFTFSSEATVKKSLPVFLAVTLFGLWILQPIVIKLTLIVLHSSTIDTAFNTVVNNADKYYELVAKLTATPVTLIWNFVLYNRLVFKKSAHTNLS